MLRVRSLVLAILTCLALLSVAPAALAAGAPTARANLVRITGTVSDWNAVSLTIQTNTDVKAVQLLSTTKYHVDGQRIDHRPDFTKGQRVGVLARQEKDGSLSARVVSIWTSNLVRLAGTVSDSNNGSLTMQLKGGDVKAVQLTGSTKYYVDGQHVTSRPAFDHGTPVHVLARQEQDSSLTALRVSLGTPDTNRVRITGTIADSNATSLTIQTQSDVKAVQLTAGTKYFVNGKPVSQRPDLTHGRHIAVLAHKEQDGSLTALRVNVALPAQRVILTGTVSDFNASSITIRTATGDVVAVQLTGTTKYFVGGKPVNQRPELEHGQLIRAVARKELDGSLAALRVGIRAAAAAPATT